MLAVLARDTVGSIIELVALMCVGHSTFEIEDWTEALETVPNEHTHAILEYLMGMLIVSDHLKAGLEVLPLEDV